jgi:hypothetical protein
MRTGFAFLGVAAAVLSSPAAAQMVSAKDPQSVVAALQAKGFQAQLDSANGRPSIRSGAGGLKLTIFFQNCTDGKACTTVTFATGFTDLEATPLKMNQWNAENRFTRAFIDEENDPMLALDLDLDHQGIPRANFNEYLDIWSSAASKYLDFLRGR